MTPEMHARMQGADDASDRATMLAAALSCAVPLWIEEVRPWTTEQRCARAHDAAGLIAMGEKCDELRGRHGAGPAHFANGAPNGDGEIFNALAMGLALLSYLPGGVTYLGLHWETKETPMTLKPGWPERAVADAAGKPKQPLFRSGTLSEQSLRQSPKRGRTHRSIAQKLDKLLGDPTAGLDDE